MSYEQEMQRLSEERRCLVDTCTELQSRIALINEDIKELHSKRQESQGMVLTDHALLRYMERECGVDVGSFRERALQQLHALNTVVKGTTVVTVLGRDMRR